jgi:hypothetical protein
MLSVIHKSGRVLQWHTGENFAGIRTLSNEISNVQADGDELEHIKRNFSNIPMTNKPVIKWFGDDAKFIVANL